MSNQLFDQEHFQSEDFTAQGLAPGRYEECIFTSCQLQGLDLSAYRFLECSFEDCDLSNVILTETAFQEVLFRRSKLLGIHFSACRTFQLALTFESCRLDYSSFAGLPLGGTSFKDCQLLETDFVETDLSGALFEHCNLEGAQFDQTKLQGADLRTAQGFIIDPRSNDVRAAQFSLGGLPGLLTQYQIVVTPDL